ncbi:MAG: hypothetical protein H0V36_05585, partial [Chloroflexi bacterium]|nr:hypothetical protein [Chloroflexota bacterium]
MNSDDLMTDWTGPVNEDFFAERERRQGYVNGGDQGLGDEPQAEPEKGMAEPETGKRKTS